MGRLPKSSPPGSDTLARPGTRQQRPEHDHRGAHLLHQLVGRLGDEVGGDVDDEVARPAVGGRRHASPARRWSRSTSAMISTSTMWGTPDRTWRPSASRQAAISLSAEFLAPPARTDAVQRPAAMDDELVHRSV